MTVRQHISEVRLAQAGAGDLALTPEEARHTNSCDACRALLHRYETLRQRIDELPVVAEASSHLWWRIVSDQAKQARHELTVERRLPTWRRHASRLVTAAALVTLGFVGGRIDARSLPARADEDQSPVPLAWQGSDAALRVQSAGTEYLAALVNLSTSAVADPVARSQGRDAALSAMYGAALEMANDVRGDDTLRRVASLLQVERARGRLDSLPPRDQAERE